MIVLKADVFYTKNNEVQDIIPCHRTARKQDALYNAAVWTRKFLNDLGGDFSLVTVLQQTGLTLRNMSCCPCSSKKIPSSEATTGLNCHPCDSMEFIIRKSIQSFDPGIACHFVQCEKDNDPYCECVISLS